MNPDWLIDLILSDAQQHGSHSFDEKIYRDEPILQPASKMKSYLPQPILEARKFARESDPWRTSGAAVFAAQARMLALYEDDALYTGSFQRYFPTYESMDDQQLRGYFGFRTRVRAGETPDAPLGFIYVLIYELLLLIGVSSPTEGFAKLQSIRSAYGSIDFNLDRQLGEWLWDFVIYYDLPPEHLAALAPMNRLFSAQTLFNWKDAENNALADALTALSPYNLERSRFYKGHAALFRETLCAAYRAYAAYYEAHRTRPLAEAYFGRRYFERCRLFAGAVFVDEKHTDDYSYEINDLCRYRCVNRNWSRDSILLPPQKPKALGKFIKTVDAELRLAFNDPHPIKTDLETAYIRSLIRTAVEETLAADRERRKPKLVLDLSKLDAIRADADETREQLLTEEERAEAQANIAPESDALPSVTSVQEAVIESDDAALPLDAASLAFLRCLAQGGDWKGTAAAANRLPSVLADEINEQLFDLFADTVIGFDGDQPYILEDYLEEVRGYLS